MNHLVELLDKNSRYETIHWSIVDTFESEILGGYVDAAIDLRTPIVNDPESDLDGMIGHYPAIHMCFAISVFRSRTEEEDWDDMTGEDIDAIHEEPLSDPSELDAIIGEDILEVLNRYSIFYIDSPFIYHPISGRTEYFPPTGFNSPIQGVW